MRQALLLLVLLCLAAPVQAFYAAESEGGSIDLGGSIRTLGAAIDNYDAPQIFGLNNDYDGQSQAILRLTAEGELRPSTAFEFHLVQSFDYATLLSALPGSTGAVPLRYRTASGYNTWAEDSDFSAALGWDRMNVKLSAGRADITLGRQAINFAETYFWNPLDIFLPFDPAAFDRDYKPGVDALRCEIELGFYSSLDLVAAPGRELYFRPTPLGATQVVARHISDDAWYGSALIGRYLTNVNNWDLAVQFGKVYGGMQLGFGFSGELGGFGLRGELACTEARGRRTITFSDPSIPGMLHQGDLIEDHFSAVLGLDYRFDSSLYLNFEYLYNGSGEADDLALASARLNIGQGQSMSRNLLGAQISYEMHPLVTGSLALIYSADDHSTLSSPGMSCSLSDESELVLGAMFGRGKRPAKIQPLYATQNRYPGQISLANLRSEFGSYPDVYYLEFKYYF